MVLAQGRGFHSHRLKHEILYIEPYETQVKIGPRYLFFTPLKQMSEVITSLWLLIVQLELIHDSLVHCEVL